MSLTFLLAVSVARVCQGCQGRAVVADLVVGRPVVEVAGCRLLALSLLVVVLGVEVGLFTR